MLIISILNYLHELIGILIARKVNNVLITNSRGGFYLILPMIPTWQCPFILGIVCLYNFLFPKGFQIMICTGSINRYLNSRIYDFINIHRMVHVGPVNIHSHFCCMELIFLSVGMSLFVCPYVMSLFIMQKCFIVIRKYILKV